MYPAAPIFTAGITLPSSAKLVRTITRTDGLAVRMRCMAWMPSTFGITRSISTTSGVRLAAAATASSPSLASPTTSRSACSWRKLRSP